MSNFPGGGGPRHAMQAIHWCPDDTIMFANSWGEAQQPCRFLTKEYFVMAYIVDVTVTAAYEWADGGDGALTETELPVAVAWWPQVWPSWAPQPAQTQPPTPEAATRPKAPPPSVPMPTTTPKAKPSTKTVSKPRPSCKPIESYIV